MRILLTNDDGFEAEGIRVLASVLSQSHEICIVAPDGNRSGASSSLTMYSMQELRDHGNSVFSLDGTPVDCVISALKGSYIPFKPDVVISGINKGANMGTDIIYSGTCGAARQACLYSVPGIALSVEKLTRDQEPYFYEPLARFVLDNLDYLVELSQGKNASTGPEGLECFVNVNAPSVERYEGARFASLCGRDYRDSVELSCENEKTFSQCIGGQILSFGPEDRDEKVVASGCVAVSLVEVSPGCRMVNLEERPGFIL